MIYGSDRLCMVIWNVLIAGIMNVHFLTHNWFTGTSNYHFWTFLDHLGKFLKHKASFSLMFPFLCHQSEAKVTCFGVGTDSISCCDTSDDGHACPLCHWSEAKDAFFNVGTDSRTCCDISVPKGHAWSYVNTLYMTL